jgi:hypothetical protein
MPFSVGSSFFDFYLVLGSIKPLICTIELAVSMEEMETKKHELSSDSSEALEKLHVLFDEMIQMCLWCVVLPSFPLCSRQVILR